MSAPAIGCIADDYTGGTDVAAAFRRQGLRTVLQFGLPEDGQRLDDCDAVVVALKTRALEADTAVKMSLAARN
ncbi:MAG TPA: four-carbon acid sugar kinase family protein, partial [Mycobacterium sp.]|nr:four-carbon acid sugar kinase family protein [Mycobacterium sp.]